MRFRVLALDYDGTIAEGGKLYPEAKGAIDEVRRRGVVVVLVTGRILDDLRTAVGDLNRFSAVVAEGGAVLAFPESDRSFFWPPHRRPFFWKRLTARAFGPWSASASSKLMLSTPPALSS